MNRLKEQGRFLRNVWLLTKSYWQSEERLKAYLLLAVIIALTLAVVYVIVLINDWFNVFTRRCKTTTPKKFLTS